MKQPPAGSVSARYRFNRLSGAVLAALPLLAPPASAQDGIAQVAGVDPSAPVARVEIIGVTPVPGVGQARNEIAAPVQRASAADIAASGALELGDFLNRRLGSVHVNEMQGNPFQMDVSYRGYTASALLGSAQGISVYLDGVRVNQPFGDVVSWDLIPRAAIASVALMPGSNPLFGLNTLGGALAVQTRDGLHHPGSALQASIGSHHRRAVEVEHGGANAQGLHWFVTANRFKEDGWRDDSPSAVAQLFGKLGWQDRATSVTVSVSHADNTLTGNGLQEQQLLARERASVYTRPDVTDNRASLISLAASHRVDERLQVSANAWYRRLRTATYNGDVNEGALDQSVYQPSAAERAALLAAGYSGYPASGANAANTPFPYWRCLGQVLLRDEPAEKCNGVINRSSSSQRNYGLTGQFSWQTTGEAYRNALVAGAGYDASRLDFTQSSQLGYLNPDRSITGVNAYGDGVTGGDVDGEPYDTRVDLAGRVRTASVYASDTLSWRRQWHLTLSGRYNRSTIDNRDRIHAAGDPASLSGEHRFARFNPALGLVWNARPTLGAYASLSESSRAPTSIELGCANPEQPCKLPNAMAGDPPLHQVVTRTLELGLRGGWPGDARALQWSAGLFNAINRDDILFVADNQAGFGYFKNFGKTRRRGLELGVDTSVGALRLDAHYTWLDATFQSGEIVNGSSNSSNEAALAGVRGVDGVIAVHAGDRIPLTPRHLFKLSAEYAVNSALSLNGGLVATSSSLARGNENGAHHSDGVVYLGPGASAGYLVASVGARWQVSPRWQVLAQVNNLFDTRYNTAAQLGPTAFDGAGNFVARPFATNNSAVRQLTFFAPGAPRLVSLSVRVAL
ncbi:TonB-dependent receptor [Massilia sp. DWR3-1-1]|uniref:TonB-dependent receptor n=1 Tax=Massilia sp. DWR3-1-1 TaxID=2804559 RepID=UPI003CE83116